MPRCACYQTYTTTNTLTKRPPYPPPRHMSPMELPLPKRLVWALQEPQLQRASVEAALVAAEDAASLAGVSKGAGGVRSAAPRCAALIAARA